MLWTAGASVLWRARPALADGRVGYVFSANVVADSATATVLFQRVGAPGMRRTGRRGGPGARSLIAAEWDGSYEPFAWGGPSTLRLHPVGSSFSNIRRWHAERARCEGWYINIEQPWRRTRHGFDSRDDVLDVEVAADLSSWHFKDEDELEWCVEVGELTVSEAERIRRAADEAIAQLEARSWPFDEHAWTDLLPDPCWPRPRLPADWASPG